MQGAVCYDPCHEPVVQSRRLNDWADLWRRGYTLTERCFISEFIYLQIQGNFVWTFVPLEKWPIFCFFRHSMSAVLMLSTQFDRHKFITLSSFCLQHVGRGTQCRSVRLQPLSLCWSDEHCSMHYGQLVDVAFTVNTACWLIRFRSHNCIIPRDGEITSLFWGVAAVAWFTSTFWLGWRSSELGGRRARHGDGGTTTAPRGNVWR